ncbi:MAG: serine/threonine-protein kinase [Minicystis sp.]
MSEPESVAELGGTPDVDEDLDRLLGDGRSEGDPVARALAQARVGAALFGDGDAAHVGRFRVLERLGAGGMGVVYTAYDPQLDRAVALKLVRVLEGRQAAALNEARALARLSHPNVVPVHDVGILDRHVYIVMELVRGQTLTRWARAERRSRREILRAYLQAGAALAAAHDAGLVHRDFKPDNVIVGQDGRVRVVDFGLACEAAAPGQRESPVRAAGTPAYMAPEQAEGRAPTPAADQYSFCTALLETLTAGGKGQGASVPRWLEAALARGRAADPAARHPSMGDLLRALAHDPARAWLRRGAVAAVALGVLTAFWGGRALRNKELGVCGGGEASIAGAWAPSGRDAALSRIAGMGEYGRSASRRIEPLLRAWEERWVGQHRDACLSHRRGEASDLLLDRRMACLAQARVALATVAETAGAVAPEKIPQLISAAAALPDPARCGALDTLVAEPAPRPGDAEALAELRAQLQRARTLASAGRRDEASEEATAAVARARRIGDRRWLAEALLVQGQAVIDLDRTRAIAPLTEAIPLALETGADAVAVEAWARRAYAQGTSDDPVAAMAGHELVEAIASRSTATAYARTMLYNCLGAVAAASDRRADARASWLRAAEEARLLADDDADLVTRVKVSVAISDPDPEHADALLAEVVDTRSRALGADHPVTLQAIIIRGVLSADLRRAHAHLASTCERFATLHPTQAQNVSNCWWELGFVDLTLGDQDGALLAFGRAASLYEATGLGKDVSSAYHALTSGRAREAADRFAGELQDPLKPGDPWWKLLPHAYAEAGLGEAHRALGSLAEAREHLERAVALFAEVSVRHPAAPCNRGLARARAQLALVRAASHADGQTTADLARSAVAYLRKVGSRSPDLAALDQLAVGDARR